MLTIPLSIVLKLIIYLIFILLDFSKNEKESFYQKCITIIFTSFIKKYLLFIHFIITNFVSSFFF
jgi:hypothetical protein